MNKATKLSYFSSIFLQIFFMERKKITYLDMTTTFYFKLKIAFGKKDEPI